MRAKWFASPVAAVREMATRSPAPGPSITNFLRAIADKDENPWLRARAIAALAAIPNESAALEKHLHDESPAIRIATFRALRTQVGALELAQKIVRDPSPPVRREVAIALRDVPFEKCGDLLVALARQVDPTDRYAVEALGIGASGKEEPLWLAIAGTGASPIAWNPFIEAITWRLHPKAAIPTLAAWANDPQRSREERQHAVTALAFIRDRAAADAMLSLALAGPADTRPLANWWIRNRDTNDWREYGLGPQVAAGHFDKAKKVWSSGVIRRDPKNVEVDVTGASTLWLVVTDGGDGNSCDWSDWVEPRIVVGGAERKLTELPWLEAGCGWGQVNLGKNCSGGALRVAGKEVAGIGTHANSRIAYALPAGATRFLASVGPDDGGVNQPGGASRRSSSRSSPRRPRTAAPSRRSQSWCWTRRVTLRRARTPPKSWRSIRKEGSSSSTSPRRGPSTPRSRRPSPPPFPTIPICRSGRSRPAGSRAPRTAEPRCPRSRSSPRWRATRAWPNCVPRRRGGVRQCHTFRGRGASIGPDLTSIRTKYGKLELLDAIVNPSAAIAFGYDTWLVATKDGRSYCGFLVADGEKRGVEGYPGKAGGDPRQGRRRED